jgi:EAL domain-containing protein (putative c-di-GMP-specific phosphodiesterase class I)
MIGVEVLRWRDPVLGIIPPCEFIPLAEETGLIIPLGKTIIVMGHSLGFSVIAEGIEEEAQARFLMEHGCEIGQGYYFSRPMPAETFRLCS